MKPFIGNLYNHVISPLYTVLNKMKRNIVISGFLRNNNINVYDYSISSIIEQYYTLDLYEMYDIYKGGEQSNWPCDHFGLIVPIKQNITTQNCRVVLFVFAIVDVNDSFPD